MAVLGTGACTPENEIFGREGDSAFMDSVDTGDTSDSGDSGDISVITEDSAEGFIEVRWETWNTTRGIPSALNEYLESRMIYSPHHQAASSFTYLSHLTIFTGLPVIKTQPSSTKDSIQNPYVDPVDQAKTTAAILREKGFATAIFYGNQYLEHGFTESFDEAVYVEDNMDATKNMYDQALQFIENQRAAGRRYYVYIFPYTLHDPYDQVSRSDDQAAIELALSTTTCPWNPADSGFTDSFHRNVESLSDSEKEDCFDLLALHYDGELHTAEDQLMAFWSRLESKGIAFSPDGRAFVSMGGDHGEGLRRENGELKGAAGGVAENHGKIGHGQAVGYAETEGVYGVWSPGEEVYQVTVRTSQMDEQCTVLEGLGFDCARPEDHSIWDVELDETGLLLSMYCNKNRGYQLTQRNADLAYREYHPMEGRDGELGKEFVSLADPYVLRTDLPPANVSDYMEDVVVSEGSAHCVQ